MAQAFRSSRSRNPDSVDKVVLVEGCYNHDQKVVVEWEMALSKPLLAEIFDELPMGALTLRAIRASLSASCRERYAFLGDGIVTNFRLNRQSTLELIRIALTEGSLSWQRNVPDADACVWVRHEFAAP